MKFLFIALMLTAAGCATIEQQRELEQQDAAFEANKNCIDPQEGQICSDKYEVDCFEEDYFYETHWGIICLKEK